METNNPTCCATFLACPGCVELSRPQVDGWITWELPTMRMLSAHSNPAQPEGQKWECKKRNGVPRWLHCTSGGPACPGLFRTTATLWSTGWLQQLVFGWKRSALHSMVTCTPPASWPLSHGGFRQPLHQVATVCPLDFFLIRRNGRQIPDVIELCSTGAEGNDVFKV